MIGIKSGTQTWSNAEQQSSLRSDGSQGMSAIERDKVLGDQNLGEFLNKVADPNWVDPKKTRQVGGTELDKDAFLKLFLAQLKNQDPTNTMDSHELAAQLAQFTSLEKLNSINEGIEGLAGKSKGAHNFDVLQMVGKTVTVDSSKIIRTDEKSSHEIAFTLPSNSPSAEISIRNAAGQEIRKIEARGLKEGSNTVDWDGRLENGTNANAGDYNVVISAKGGSGQKLHAETRFQGQVTGVNFTGQGPVLLVGKQTIKMSDIKGIVDTELDLKNASTLDAHKVTNTKNLKARDAGQPDLTVAGMGGNLESVAMQQGLINKIQKEVAKQQPNQGDKQ